MMIETIDQLRRQFLIVFEKSNRLSHSELPLERLVDIAWYYRFGSPSYKAHLRRTYNRRVFIDIETVIDQIDIFINTIEALYKFDEFKKICDEYTRKLNEESEKHNVFIKTSI